MVRISTRSFSDFFLGELDGADFAKHVRHDEDCCNREVPILLITGMPDHHKVVKVLDAGINGMLAKPISAKGLYHRIHAMLADPKPFVITKRLCGSDAQQEEAAPLKEAAAGRFQHQCTGEEATRARQSRLRRRHSDLTRQPLNRFFAPRRSGPCPKVDIDNQKQEFSVRILGIVLQIDCFHREPSAEFLGNGHRPSKVVGYEQDAMRHSQSLGNMVLTPSLFLQP